MKKLLLLCAAGAVSFAGIAQVSKFGAPLQQPESFAKAQTRTVTHSTTGNKAVHHLGQLGKTTSVAFYTQSFNGGIPAGWSATSSAGSGTWKWINQAAAGAYNIGALNSTTASDGWMIYDSDSIGAVTNATNLDGILESAPINCSGHTTVQLAFQEDFRAWYDSCYVAVSTDGVSYTGYPVLSNNDLANGATTTNPYTVKINISATAANSPSVYVRFVYHFNGPAGGGYNWLLDDMTLSELDPNELSVDKGGIVLTSGGTFANIPLQLIDSVTPYTLFTSNGSQAQAAVSANAKIFQNGTQVYSQNQSYTGSLAANAFDSLLYWDVAYLPNDTGLYTVAISNTTSGDADASNNADTATFRVNNTLYSVNGAGGNSSYYVHRAPAGTTAESSNFIATLFTIPATKSDTLTGTYVAFDNSTAVGAPVVVQIYKFNGAASGNQWDFVTSMVQKSLTAADISTSTATTFAFFGDDLSNGVSSFVLDGGTGGATYAAAVEGNGVATASDVLVMSSQPANLYGYGYSGFISPSTNDGAPTFGGGTSADQGTISSTPRIILEFANASNLSAGNIAAYAGIGDAYPNPANTQLNIPVIMKQQGNVSVTLSNTMGQTVASKRFGNLTAGATATCSFATGNLADGIYFYTVTVDGNRTTGRVNIAH